MTTQINFNAANARIEEFYEEARRRRIARFLYEALADRQRRRRQAQREGRRRKGD